MPFDNTAYGDDLADLLVTTEPNVLGPGTPNDGLYGRLQALDHTALFGARAVVDDAAADCCLSGIWLLHNYLDESHRISQDVATNTGSYWHGIMHRREPDFSNSKYWFRRVGDHEVFDDLCVAASELARAANVDRQGQYLLEQTSWDPFRFVDLCETATRTGENELLCRQIAEAEWQLLFDYCYRKACG